MGRRTKTRQPETIDVGVTLLGIVGFLGFLAAARMNEADGAPFDTLALVWFAVFGAIKIGLPRLLANRDRSARRRAERGLTY
jgi:hypothetical protein